MIFEQQTGVPSIFYVQVRTLELSSTSVAHFEQIFGEDNCPLFPAFRVSHERVVFCGGGGGGRLWSQNLMLSGKSSIRYLHFPGSWSPAKLGCWWNHVKCNSFFSLRLRTVRESIIMLRHCLNRIFMSFISYTSCREEKVLNSKSPLREWCSRRMKMASVSNQSKRCKLRSTTNIRP